MYCFKVKFPVDLLIDEKILDSLPRNRHFRIQRSEYKKYFNEEILTIIDGLKLSISLVEVFWKPAKDNSSAIHLDSSFGDFTKINWIYLGKNSSMRWYRPLPGQGGVSRTTSIGTPYITFPPEHVELVHQEELKNSYIVQAGVPHDVDNPDQERFCFSMVCRYRNNQLLRPTMKESLEIFKPFITDTTS